MDGLLLFIAMELVIIAGLLAIITDSLLRIERHLSRRWEIK